MGANDEALVNESHNPGSNGEGAVRRCLERPEVDGFRWRLPATSHSLCALPGRGVRGARCGLAESSRVLRVTKRWEVRAEKPPRGPGISVTDGTVCTHTHMYEQLGRARPLRLRMCRLGDRQPYRAHPTPGIYTSESDPSVSAEPAIAYCSWLQLAVVNWLQAALLL